MNRESHTKLDESAKFIPFQYLIPAEKMLLTVSVVQIAGKQISNRKITETIDSSR